MAVQTRCKIREQVGTLRVVLRAGVFETIG